MQDTYTRLKSYRFYNQQEEWGNETHYAIGFEIGGWDYEEVLDIVEKKFELVILNSSCLFLDSDDDFCEIYIEVVIEGEKREEITDLFKKTFSKK